MKAWLAASLAFGWLCVGADPGVAQSYPAKPIHIVVATVPGGVTDLLGRSLAWVDAWLGIQPSDAYVAETLGPLPEWDLSDLYPGPDDPGIARDLDWLRQECPGFAADYEGRLDQLDAAGLLAAIRRWERIQTVSGRIMSFASLRHYQDTLDANRAKFFGDVQEHISALRETLGSWGERVEDGMDEEAFIAAARYDVSQTDPGLVDEYQLAGPYWHHFRGLERYWRKRREAAAAATS